MYLLEQRAAVVVQVGKDVVRMWISKGDLLRCNAVGSDSKK